MNVLKDKLKRNEKVVGTFFETGSTITMECLGLGGMDYAIIDMEHGPFETESVMEFVSSAERRNIVPLVRTKDASRSAILKCLDVGAKGLIIPDIYTLDEVKEIVSCAKYFPFGKRGVAYGRGCGYGYAEPMPILDYFEKENRETLLIPQCETAECLDIIDEVVALPGVDGIFIGPFDLSTALGKPGDFEDPEVRSAIRRILDACHKAGKISMIYADNGTAGRNLLQQGFDSVAVNMDTILIIRMIMELKKEVLHQD